MLWLYGCVILDVSFRRIEWCLACWQAHERDFQIFFFFVFDFVCLDWTREIILSLYVFLFVDFYEQEFRKKPEIATTCDANGLCSFFSVAADRYSRYITRFYMFHIFLILVPVSDDDDVFICSYFHLVDYNCSWYRYSKLARCQKSFFSSSRSLVSVSGVQRANWKLVRQPTSVCCFRACVVLIWCFLPDYLCRFFATGKIGLKILFEIRRFRTRRV